MPTATQLSWITVKNIYIHIKTSSGYIVQATSRSGAVDLTRELPQEVILPDTKRKVCHTGLKASVPQFRLLNQRVIPNS